MSLAKDLSEKILALVEKSPVYQSDLTGMLCIKHDQRIAEAVKILLNDHKVSRIRENHTYLISLNGSHEKAQINFDALLNKGVFAPCTGCHTECAPSTCDRITEWVTS